MRYVRRVLQPGETVVYATKLHWFVYLWAILLFIICLVLAGAAQSMSDKENISLALGIAAVIFALLALSSALRASVRRATTELAVTDQRVIYKTGLIARHTLEMNRGKVESVTVDQTPLARIFGYGTVTVRGIGSALEPIRNITDPLTFRSHLTTG
jgi:membrane protein YdbS with pleckstrin-like domain